MENANKSIPVKSQSVIMVVKGELTTSSTGKPMIRGLFRNADGSSQNFTALEKAATKLEAFRKGSHLLITGFSTKKTVATLAGGTKEVNDIVVLGFTVDKVAQEASNAAYKAEQDAKKALATMSA